MDKLSEASPNTPSVERIRRTLTLRRLAATPSRARAKNTLVITHRSNIADAFGPLDVTVRDGELLVFRPRQEVW
jgi:hypothetical protein